MSINSALVKGINKLLSVLNLRLVARSQFQLQRNELEQQRRENRELQKKVNKLTNRIDRQQRSAVITRIENLYEIQQLKLKEQAGATADDIAVRELPDTKN